MENRGLLRVVQRIISQVQTITNIAFGQIFLPAPDVDVYLFKELAKGYLQLAERTTLYISSKDKAFALFVQQSPLNLQIFALNYIF